jgi:outer membrane scaffolding protein for murein synthesis (MipA/OmpV family)
LHDAYNATLALQRSTQNLYCKNYSYRLAHARAAMSSAWRLRGAWGIFLMASFARPALAQTPSPLQEWQYSGGVILARLFEPDLPEFRRIVGLAVDVDPLYNGARDYRTQAGPVLSFYYKDIAFASIGDGIGYNILRGDHYQIGVAVAYDLGRNEQSDLNNLRGLGDIGAAPVAKAYGTWVLSKKFPLILRADARQFVGGAQGAVGDVGVYMPLPGSSKTFVMFAGPSVSFATHHYLQTVYGITPQQAAASGHPAFDIDHAGMSQVGVGFSATKFITSHWLVNLDSALSQIRGSSAHSPLVEARTQRVLALSVNYQW